MEVAHDSLGLPPPGINFQADQDEPLHCLKWSPSSVPRTTTFRKSEFVETIAGAVGLFPPPGISFHGLQPLANCLYGYRCPYLALSGL